MAPTFGFANEVVYRSFKMLEPPTFTLALSAGSA